MDNNQGKQMNNIITADQAYYKTLEVNTKQKLKAHEVAMDMVPNIQELIIKEINRGYFFCRIDAPTSTTYEEKVYIYEAISKIFSPFGFKCYRHEVIAYMLDWSQKEIKEVLG